MRFLLRLLILIILGAYLLGRYGPYVRQQFLGAYLADEQQRLPALAKNGQPSQSLTQPGYLPRRDLTPGAIDPRVTQGNIASTICRRGYTATVRPPYEYSNAMKHRLMRAYGVTGSIHDYELDHLIPLELGG